MAVARHFFNVATALFSYTTSKFKCNIVLELFPPSHIADNLLSYHTLQPRFHDSFYFKKGKVHLNTFVRRIVNQIIS